MIIGTCLVLSACQATTGKKNVSLPQAVPTPVVAAVPVEDVTPAFNPETVIGRSIADIQHVLGDPYFLRWEGPAQVMQYKNQRCVVDLFFYEAKPGAPFLLTHMAGRSDDGKRMEAGDCFRSHLPDGKWPG